MTPEEQLKLWVEGKSVHNTTRDECCPDFSCCNKDVNTPIGVRQRFMEAHQDGDQKVINTMLGMFLGKMFSKSSKKVYIAGVDDPEDMENVQ